MTVSHDPTQPRISNWYKIFAWTPKKLTNGRRVWLKFIYKRDIVIDWMPPAYPAKKYFSVQYTDINGVIKDKLIQKNR
jgi:hypothetical protein